MRAHVIVPIAWLAFACGPVREPVSGPPGQVTETLLAARSISVEVGSTGSGQSLAALARRDLGEKQDVWDKYVEFAPGTRAVLGFPLPAGVSVDSISALTLRTSYRGPAQADMRWVFEAWDVRAGEWVLVSDNGFAASWTWSPAEVALPAPAGRFIAGGEIRIRYGTSSRRDRSQLDELVLLAVSGGAGSAADAGVALPGSGTPPDAGEVPFDSGIGIDPGAVQADAGTDQADGSQAGSKPEDAGEVGTGSETGTIDAGTSAGSGSIWRPRPGTSWQWQLSGGIDTSFDVAMYDLDLFDTSQAVIDALHASGRVVICYVSAGTFEDWRPDAAGFPRTAIGNSVDGWAGENWLDVRNPGVRAIMQARLDLAVAKRCDGVEPDNVDGYANATGFPLTAADQLAYNRFLAAEAHARGLSIGLKNDLGQVVDLVNDFDWALNEECFQFGECGLLAPFINAGKAVFEVEYGDAVLASSVCSKANALGFDSLIKNLELDAWRVPCR